MNRVLKNLIYAGLFLVPFIPFVVAESLLFPFITGKAFLYRVLVEIVFALWLSLAIRNPEYRPRASWVLKSVAVFMLVVLVADIFALDSYKAFWSNYERMEGFIALAHHFALFLVLISVFKTKEIWNKFFAVNVGASAIMAFYSFLQLAGKITINQGGFRVDGTFGNSAYLGIYMVFNIFLAAMLFFQPRSKSQKYLIGLTALVDIVVLYFTATRGAVLGLLGGAFIAFVYMAIKANRGEVIRKAALAFVSVLVVGSGIFWSVRNTSFVKDNMVLQRFGSISFDEIKNQGRYFVWPMAIEGFKENPILGWGQEGFSSVFNKNYDPRMYGQEPWFDRTHNIILDWTVNAGALGIISYLLMFVALLYSLRRSSDASKEEKGLLYGLLFAYLFYNLFIFDQIGSYIMFFTILSYAHYLFVKSLPLNQGLTTNIFWDKLNSVGMRPISDSLIVILSIVALYFVNYVPWQQNKQIIDALKVSNSQTVVDAKIFTKPLQDYHMGTAEALEHVPNSALNAINNAQSSPEFRQEVFDAVDAAFMNHLESFPFSVRHRLFYAMFLSRFGLYDKSIPELDEAIKFSPRKQSLYIERGSELLQSGKTEEAVADFKKAYELETSYDEARFTYALGAILVRDTILADELLKNFPHDKLVNDDRYVSVLYQLGKYNEAALVISERIEKNPTNTQNYLTLAGMYLQAGRRPEAILEIQKVIEIDPTFKEKGEYFISEIRAGRNP